MNTISSVTPVTAMPTGRLARPEPLSIQDTFASAGKELNTANIAKLTAGTVVGAGIGAYAGVASGWIPGIAGLAVGTLAMGISGVLLAAKLTESKEASTQVGGMLIGGSLGAVAGGVGGAILGFQSGGFASGAVMAVAGGVAGFAVTLFSLAGKS